MKGRGSAKAPPSILGEIVDVLIEPVVSHQEWKEEAGPQGAGGA